MSIEELSNAAVPKANAFRVYGCNDPECGPHIVLFDKDNKPMCQMVLTRDRAAQLATYLFQEWVPTEGKA